MLVDVKGAGEALKKKKTGAWQAQKKKGTYTRILTFAQNGTYK
jgi:hypothetical protein